MKGVKLSIVEVNEKRRLYVSSKENIDTDSQYIGYMRFDFGRGREFWYTWFDGSVELKTKKFQREFQKVVDNLRQCGIIGTYEELLNTCKQNELARINENEFGFKLIRNGYIYYIRCSVQRYDYNYIYCYKESIDIS